MADLHEFTTALEGVVRLAEDIESHDPLPVPDLCALWLALGDARRRVLQAYDALQKEASEALHAQVGDSRNGLPIIGKRSITDTPFGPVLLEREPPKRRSDGYRIARALCTRAVDPATGEALWAVPLDVLQRVVPAVAAEGVNGYGWRWARAGGVARRRVRPAGRCHPAGAARGAHQASRGAAVKTHPLRIPAARLRQCERCDASVDSKADGVARLATAWVANRSQGGGNALIAPAWHERYLCRDCVGKLRAGLPPGQDSLFGGEP